MILTKDRLDELAKEKAEEILSKVEDEIKDALIDAKYQELSHLYLTASTEYPWWALEKVGKAYEKEGYRVVYHNNMPYSFPPSYILIIIDDEKYDGEEEEERKWRENHIIIPDKKWWEFWK